MKRYSLFIFSLAISFFFYEFFFSVVLGTIAPEFIDSLNLSSEDFTLIGSAYFIVYGLMQTPVGLLVDRFGVRVMLTLASLTCSLGVFILSISDSFWTALFSRLVTGLGSAFAFVSILVIILNWFPKKHFSFLSGLAFLLGMIGPFLAGAPLVFMMDAVDNNWRYLFRWFSVFGLILSGIIAIFIRNKPERKPQEIIFIDRKKEIFSNILTLLTTKQIWIIMIYAGLIYAPMLLLGAFWGTSYLEARGFEKSLASLTISMLWLGLALSAPIYAKISEIKSRRKIVLIPLAILGLLISSYILYLKPENTFFTLILFFMLGSCCAAQSLSFTLISENVSEKIRSTAMGLNNTIIILISVLVPNIATQLMGPADQEFVFDVSDFTLGFSVIPISFALSLLLCSFGIKETYCRNQDVVHTLSP